MLALTNALAFAFMIQAFCRDCDGVLSESAVLPASFSYRSFEAARSAIRRGHYRATGRGLAQTPVGLAAVSRSYDIFSRFYS